MEVKEKEGAVELVGSLGCALIEVFGAAVSTWNVRLTGVWTFVAVSVARTRIA